MRAPRADAARINAPISTIAVRAWASETSWRSHTGTPLPAVAPPAPGFAASLPLALPAPFTAASSSPVAALALRRCALRFDQLDIVNHSSTSLASQARNSPQDTDFPTIAASNFVTLCTENIIVLVSDEHKSEAGSRQGRGRGRPRNAEVDRAVLAAAVDLLAEHGFGQLTVEAVASRAGVGRPTVYRRWPTKEDLAVHALIHSVPPLTAPDTGDAVGDLCELAVGFVTELSNSPLGSVVLGVHAECGRRPELGNPLREHYLQPRDAVITDLVERGRREGAIRPDIPADTVRDLVFGPLIYRWLITGEPVDRATAELLVSTARRAVAPGER